MRLIAKFDSQEKAERFLRVLLAQDIDSRFEKEEEGEFLVWAVQEDQVKAAEELHRDFLEGKEQKEVSPVIQEPIEEGQIPLQNVYLAPLTRFFIFLCTVIFLASTYQLYHMKHVQKSLFPIFTKVQQNLMYDFPEALVYANELTQEYGITKETKIEDLPEPAKKILQKIESEPIWAGLYYILLHSQESGSLLEAKMFTDIRRGEVWRLVSPAFLHIEFLHLIFNLLWVWMLGKMIEKNLKFKRYLFFVIITAMITNTLQYLMTGPFFMGFSGVVSAMAGYIWVRKKNAPWEMYPIDFGALIFLWIFIFGLFALQIVAFFLEILHIVSFQLNIANTAHVSGVVLGMILGRLSLFQRKM